jgi:hypothetical protein
VHEDRRFCGSRFGYSLASRQEVEARGVFVIAATRGQAALKKGFGYDRRDCRDAHHDLRIEPSPLRFAEDPR